LPGWTLERLRDEGFSNAIIEALGSVTKRDGEDYEAFVQRAAANPIGRSVRLADLHDNCDLSRIAVPSERDFQRIEKYRRAIDLISRRTSAVIVRQSHRYSGSSEPPGTVSLAFRSF
jgi:hypothetical protein